MKASHVTETKPHKVYNQHASKLYVYVGNINPSTNDFFKPAAIFRRAEILSSNRGVSRGFNYGDMFVKYLCGSMVVIDKRQLKSGQKKCCFRSATPEEQQTVQHKMPLIERELKWRKNSYCESTTRRNHRTQQQEYCWTSNAEAKRRAKHSERNKQYYYDRKKRR
mgnify:FL=1